MYEVEMKVRADRAVVRERLVDRGARRVDAVVQRDTYYDAPHREFAETDEALRLRRERRVDATGDGSSEDGADPAGGRSDREERSADESSTVDGSSDTEESSAVGVSTRITYKGPLVEAASKTRQEFETGVGDGEVMDDILTELGFEAAAVVEKRRERYALDGYTVTLDVVTDVGEFVEVEREAPEAEVESVREGAYRVLRDLGLDPEDGIRTSYLEMVLDAANGG